MTRDEEHGLYRIVRPEAIEAYLRRTGWHEYHHREPDRASFWWRSEGDVPREMGGIPLMVALHPQFRDYVLRVAEVGRYLGHAEGRYPAEVIREIVLEDMG